MATQTKTKQPTSKQSGRRKVKALSARLEEIQAAPKPKKRPKIDPQNLKAIRFLEAMDNATPEEIQEQKETWAFLKKALDEDRLSPDRPHFPSENESP